MFVHNPRAIGDAYQEGWDDAEAVWRAKIDSVLEACGKDEISAETALIRLLEQREPTTGT